MSLLPVLTLADNHRKLPALDHQSFGAVVEEYQVAVYNLCYRMLGDAYQAEDAAQEAFLRAFRSLERFDPARSIRTWLLSIAAHHCIDVLRRRSRLDWLPLGERPLVEPGVGPEAALLKSEAEAEVRRLLAGLKPEERAVIVLHYWYDLSNEEIAEVTKSTVDTVRTRLYRARRHLAATGAMEPEGRRNEPQAV
jgi:RNA polymerase sigma-70 factor (ECF subfamily)